MQLVRLNRLGLGTRHATDVDAQLWLNAVVAAGGTVSGARLYVVSNLIASLKAAGIWTKLDRIWLHAAENATQALYDLKARAAATAVNSPTFTIDRGYAGNGTTSYLDSNFNASTAGGNFTQNDAGMGVWVVTSPGANGGCVIGANNSSYSRIILNSVAGTRETEINSSASLAASNVAVHTGFVHASRTGANAQAGYLNAASERTGAQASTALLNQTHKILANVTSGGTLGQWSTAQVGASFIGASLAGLELAFYTALRTYMTALGISSHDSDATAWGAAVFTAGGALSAGRFGTVNTLVESLKSGGAWSGLDRLWLHAAENATQALIDLKARSTATAVNSPTFTADRGYTGNGTTNYLNLNLAANAGGINFTRDDASFGSIEFSVLHRRPELKAKIFQVFN